MLRGFIAGELPNDGPPKMAVKGMSGTLASLCQLLKQLDAPLKAMNQQVVNLGDLQLHQA